MKLFAGSYTEKVLEGLEGHGHGIYVFDFDENNGMLKFLYSEKNRNTAYISLSKEKNKLYTFQELTLEKQPKLLTYEIESNSLKLLNKHRILGGLPCHIENVDSQNLLLVACYQTGNLLVFNLNEAGVPSDLIQEIKHNGQSVNVLRQESAHAHMVNFNRNDGFVYVPDLGIDKVLVYSITAECKLIEMYQILLPQGGGPRHMVFHPSNQYAFVMNELTGDVGLLKNLDGTFNWIKNVTSIAKGCLKQASSSAIKISNSGQFVYCGDRANQTISILEFDLKNESLKLVNNQKTYGLTPRDFTLSPNGKWMLVANQDSDSIVVFEIQENTGLLKKHYELNEVKSITCLKF